MIPALTVVLLLGVVLVCIQVALDAEPRPEYAPVAPVAINEGLEWRRYHAAVRQLDAIHAHLSQPPVLIGQPRVAYQLPDKRMSAQVAA